MIPVHCKPVTQTGRETGSYILCHSLSWQKFSAQDRMAELGMKEKLFWLNLRCTGKTGQVWTKWDFRKLAGITKSQGTALLSPGFKSITTFKLKKKEKMKKGNTAVHFGSKANPLAALFLELQWAVTDLTKALEPGGQSQPNPDPHQLLDLSGKEEVIYLSGLLGGFC